MKNLVIISQIYIFIFCLIIFPSSVFLNSIKNNLFDSSIYDIFNEIGDYESEAKISKFPECLPVEKLIKGKDRPGTSQENEQLMPDWFNRELALKGKEFARNHFFHIFYTLGLGMIIQASSMTSLRRIFAFTGKTTNSYSAAKRFTANFLQMKVWYDSKTFDDDQNFFDSLVTVRGIHESVSFKAGKNKTFNIDVPAFEPPKGYKDSRMWRAFKRDIERSGVKQFYPLKRDKEPTKVKFNQFDMSGGMWTFMCLPLIMPEKLDLQGATEEDIFGFVHLWAGIGYLLGIENEYNIALQRDFNEARDFCTKMYEETILPNFFNIDYEGQISVEFAIEGIQGLIPNLNTNEGLLLKVLEDIVGIKAPNLRREIGWQGIALRPLENYFLRPLLRGPWSKQIMNYYMRMWLRVASLKYFGFDGNNLTEVAEKGYFY